MRVVAISVILALLPFASYAASYFVTQAGAGGHNGSSLANAWSVANYNVSSVPTGGDTVFFSGTITSDISTGHGGNGNGAGRLTLDFSDATLSGASINVNNSFVTLTGGTVTDSGNGTTVTCSTNTSIGNITVQNFTYTGPTTGTTTFYDNGQCSNITIQNNTIDNIGYFFNSYRGLTHDITISNNFARTSTSTAVQMDVVNISDAYNVIIEGNKLIQRAPGNNSNPASHNDVIQTYQSGSGSAAPPSAWTVRYNWIALNMNTSFRTGDNSWMQLEGFNNAHGFGMKIYGNVFVGEGSTFSGNNGFGASSNATYYVYNNTVIRKNGPDRTIGFIAGGTLNMRNNIMQVTPGTGGTDIDVSAMTPGTGGYDYNFWYNLDGSSTANTFGSHGSATTNPNFTNYNSDDFSLGDSSTLKNAGDSSIGSEYNQGIATSATWPNPQLTARLPGAWDVGAFQSSGDPPPETTSNSFSGSVSISGNFSMK